MHFGVGPPRWLMCGRFVSTTSPEELAAYFGAEPPDPDIDLGVRYNVAPTQGVLAVGESTGRRQIEVLRWGLVPFWAKDPKIGNRMINARAETVGEKNSFRGPFAKRRCIVAADGFYEWRKDAGSKKKQPMYITRVDSSPMAFAALWEIWDDHRHPDTSGEPMQLHSCTIITTSPNEVMAEIHDRMPVMLAPSAWDEWLDPSNHDVDSLARLLVSAPSRLIRVRRVSADVNNVRNDHARLIEALPPG